jgi:hypothetical protein
MSMFTDEQMRVILGMGDISGQEAELARQREIANQLRQAGSGSRRMDWASQVARGASGLYGGYQDYQNRMTGQKLGDTKLDMLRKLYGGGASAPAGLA